MMMSVNDLNYAAATATDERANAWRHWIGLVTALTDAVVWSWRSWRSPR
jgi:predicted membrane channel-forming protein YqfA (hemolysin III family)